VAEPSKRSSSLPSQVPALVVGCGPVGLSATIELARRGVPCLAVERHPGTAIHPKARGINARTMEIFRQWGIEDDVRDAGLPPERHGFFYRGRSLVDPDFTRYGGGGLAADISALSPTTWMVISQDVLEPLLLRHASSLPDADIRFGTEVIAIEPGDDWVGVEIRDRASGAVRSTQARFVVGADGADSLVREALGVPLLGERDLAHNVSIFFEARLSDVVADRSSAVYYLADDPDERPFGRPMSVGNPPSGGVLLTVDNADRWLLVVTDPDQGTGLGSFTDERCSELVRRATGLPALEVHVLSLLAWVPSAQAAERYRVGRCLLAGDAAHQMTPSGAFGLNVGIGDAHNLGWKIAAIEAGWAAPDLLESYHDERRPVGVFAADQSFRQFAGAQGAKPFGNWGVIFGATYDSGAVVPDGSPPPQLDDPATDYRPGARPGARGPHAWLERDGARISTLDLFGGGFVLLAGADGAAWVAAGREVAAASGIPLEAYRIGEDVVPADGSLPDYGIDTDGCVLVRPDGHVGWRAHGSDPDPARGLGSVLGRIVGRPLASS
jgi:putative polyketide hydroxylase